MGQDGFKMASRNDAYMLLSKTEECRTPLAQPKSQAKGNEQWKCEDSFNKSADSCLQRAPRTATESFFRKNDPKVVQGSHLRCEISVSPRRERSELMFVQWCRTICVDDCSTFSLKSSTTLSNGVVFQKKKDPKVVQGSHLRCEISVSCIRKRPHVRVLPWRRAKIEGQKVQPGLQQQIIRSAPSSFGEHETVEKVKIFTFG